MLRIRAERLRRGLRQVDVARMARVPEPEVCRIEKGNTQPYPNHRLRLAEALGIAPDELLEEVELQIVSPHGGGGSGRRPRSPRRSTGR
jgi:transcriptional regulator with XRE-family HTH domain